MASSSASGFVPTNRMVSQVGSTTQAPKERANIESVLSMSDQDVSFTGVDCLEMLLSPLRLRKNDVLNTDIICSLLATGRLGCF